MRGGRGKLSFVVGNWGKNAYVRHFCDIRVTLVAVTFTMVVYAENGGRMSHVAALLRVLGILLSECSIVLVTVMEHMF